jgi:hypothetical protein
MELRFPCTRHVEGSETILVAALNACTGLLVADIAVLEEKYQSHVHVNSIESRVTYKLPSLSGDFLYVHDRLHKGLIAQ